MQLMLKTFFSRSVATDELYRVMSAFPELDKSFQVFGVEAEMVAGLKQKISTKILSLARMEKQASSQPEVVAENLCLQIQNLRKVLAIEASDSDLTIMRALAVICDLASKDATTPFDLARGTLPGRGA